MSGPGLVALVSVAVWLGLLTLVVILLVRQVAVMTGRFEMGMPRFSPATDGLVIGKAVPQAVADAIPALNSEVVYIMLLSATCGPCRELVPQFERQHLPEKFVALLAGRAEVAAGLAELLPAWIQVIRDPLATSLAKELEIQSTPFAMEIEGGHITGKAYLYGISDLLRLVEARRSGARRLTHKPAGVTSNVS